jgi:hypothetical protein
MIYVNINEFKLSPEWKNRAKELTRELADLPPDQRTDFMRRKRDLTWGADEVLEAMRAIVGNKCWYSEVPLEGADPNIDHFRPKGQIKEIDEDLQETHKTSPGYWWLAFDHLNFRLSSMHTNQRRVDIDTNGGKWDYFPILGARALEGTQCLQIMENKLALDPCSASDVRLLFFDPDGKPCCADWKRQPSPLDQRRVKTTIWLYHLDKREIVARRSQHMDQIRIDLALADAMYQLWMPNSVNPDLQAKNSFDFKIAEIKVKLSDKAEFAGAKRSAVRSAVVDYEWIDEFLPF